MKTLLSLLILLLATSCVRHGYPRPRYEEFIPPPSHQPFANPPTLVCPTKRIPTRNENIIMIDAGHGGTDLGALSVGTPQYQEKSLNLSTAEMLKRYLEQYGYSVIMTRDKDIFIPLNQRAALANGKKPKIFVSVHYNSAPSSSAEGIEVFYYNAEENASRTKESQVLAQSILKQVIKNTQAKSRGVKHGDFAVIRETTMPAVLIEGGFLTNVNEMQKIKDASYLKKLTLGIAQGIRDYLAIH